MPKPRASCSECRRLKIRCILNADSSTPCSNCSRRRKPCDTSLADAVKAVRPATYLERGGHPQKYPGGHFDRTSHEDGTAGQPVGGDIDGAVDPPSRYQIREHHITADPQERAHQLHDLLWHIYEQVYEPRVSLFTGSSCCPYVGSLHVWKSYQWSYTHSDTCGSSHVQ